jgi:hypothetical protein
MMAGRRHGRHCEVSTKEVLMMGTLQEAAGKSEQRDRRSRTCMVKQTVEVDVK